MFAPARLADNHFVVIMTFGFDIPPLSTNILLKTTKTPDQVALAIPSTFSMNRKAERHSIAIRRDQG
jgi:hypothetical protein